MMKQHMRNRQEEEDVKTLYLVMSPQYHSASCSEHAGGARQLLLMVEDTGFVDLGGRAASRMDTTKTNISTA